MRSGGVVLFGALLSVGAVAASSASDAAIARAAQASLEKAVEPGGPGAAVLIAKGDEVLFRGARGLAEIELQVPLSPDHVFRIASVTKMFTAATVMKLAEGGQLSLDDPLAAFLPDFPNAAGVTLRELLRHTAGISDVANDPQPGFGRRDVDLATRIAEIGQRPLAFAPGKSWAYSNSGFILLGGVIEKVAGEPWHLALQKRLLEPLGLKHTRYGAAAPLIPGRAAGYSTDGDTGAVRNADFISMSIPASAGALVSTVDDLRLWMRALATGRVISKAGFEQMITPAPNPPPAPARFRYGLGLFLWQVRGSRMVGHTGQINGFAAVVGYLPAQGITVIALANDDDFDARTMGRRLAAIALGQPYREAEAVPTTAAELQPLVGTYQLDETMVETLSIRGARLYAQRGSRRALPLQVTADGELHFVPDELSYFAPVRDAAGKVTALDYFADGEGPPSRLPRVEATPRLQ